MFSKISVEGMPVPQVSGQVLQEVLYEKGYAVAPCSSMRTVYCNQVRLYYPGMRLQSGQAAVISAQSELALAEASEALLIYVGDFSEDGEDGRHSHGFWVKNGRSAAEVFAVLQDFFLAFYQWDAQMKHLVYTDGTVAQLGQAAYDFLGMQMTIFDENYVILFRTDGRKRIYPVEYNAAVNGYVYQEADVHEWKEASDMVETMKTTGLQWWQPDAQSRCIYCNIRSKTGKWKGRMIMYPRDGEFGNTAWEMAEYFMSYLTLLVNAGNSFGQASQELKRVLKESLEKGRMEISEMLSKLLQQLGWGRDDSYQTYCLSQMKKDEYQDMHMEQLTCSNIEDKLSQAKAFVFQECIIVLVNLTASGQSEADVRMKLVYIVRDGLFKMGISMPFSHFEQFPLYYAQAFEAMPAQDMGEECWYREFGSYRLRYAMKVLRNDPVAASIYSSAMRTLYRYDQENGTELFQTLGVYLEKERSLKQTALYFRINRTTVNYRLNRIQEMTDVNLDDPEERLLLLMLYQMHREGYLP